MKIGEHRSTLPATAEEAIRVARAEPSSVRRAANAVSPSGTTGTSGPADAFAVGTDRPATLRDVPTLAELEGVKSGNVDPAAIEGRLKAALLSPDPRAVKKAVGVLQVAESYQRKSAQDAAHYAGTGFRPFSWPGISVRLTAEETERVLHKLEQLGDGPSVDILAMASARGVLATHPPDAVRTSPQLAALRSERPALLPGSDGRESPRGAATFQAEWDDQVKPGLDNIREAIVQTAQATGCPYARGNHAKGVAFDGAKMALDEGAPPWARELLGSSLDGGMLRVSGSQTNPHESDQKTHMPGIRVVFPVKGELDGSSTQLIDITANTGDTTHANTAAEHTNFTNTFSVPREGLRGARPVVAAKHVLGALFGDGDPMERIKQMRNAVGVAKMAMGERFHEHDFFGRHAFFVGGRYVQVRFEVVEPRNFRDPNGDEHPNARLNAVSEAVARDGLKLAMYVTELPEGRPELVEQEGWKDLPEKRLATITVPPQQQRADSAAARWFDEVPHVPGGKDKVFHAVGLGRHRVPIYEQSGKVRNGG